MLEHPQTALSAPLRRLARKILGQTVGLALGGGAAFGIAHIGALLALDRAVLNIPGISLHLDLLGEIHHEDGLTLIQ